MAKGRSAAVVVNYGSHDLLSRFLDASCEGIDDIVVVDSFHSPGERAAMVDVARARGWNLVSPPTNVGFGGGVNLGVAHALALGADVLLLVNPDARLGAGVAPTLVEAARDRPMHVIAPTIRRAGRAVASPAPSYLRLDDGTMRPASQPASDGGERAWLSGACLALSSELWIAVGGIDEEYFLYWEDVDFSIRIQDCGGVLEVIEGLDVVHDEGATHRSDSSTRVKSETYYYYNIRNRLRFAARHLGESDQRRWRRTSIRAAREILLRGGRRQLVHLAPWRAALRGTLDGLRDLKTVHAAARPKPAQPTAEAS